jgi:hypothetical protein
MSKLLVDRLTEIRTYKASELGGTVFRSPRGDRINDDECILVSLQTRDELIAALREKTA